MENKKKPKQFLEKPQYPGGTKALREFCNILKTLWNSVLRVLYR